MELSQILRTLWARKVALGCVVVLAAVAASQAGKHSRGAPSGAATAQILVDSPQSALGSLKQNTAPLTTRAGVFAQFMASSAVRDAIARAAGVPSDQILAQGPFDDPAAAPIAAGAPKPPDTASLSQGKKYRLLFASQTDLPLITVYAQAPTARQAGLLADGVGKGVQTYVDRLESTGTLAPNHRVVIRTLGPAQAGWVAAKSPLAVLVLAFAAVVAVGCLGILVLARMTARRMRRRSDDADVLLLDEEELVAPVAGDGAPAESGSRGRAARAA